MSDTLIRVWKDYGHEPAMAFVDWHNGRFSLPADHPIARELWDTTARRTYRITVFSSDELEWTVDQISSSSETDSYRFICMPRLKHLRASLLSDQYLVELWLAAEREWGQKIALRHALGEELWEEFLAHYSSDSVSEKLKILGICRRLVDDGWRKD